MPAHNALTGSDLHEPKGVAAATSDTVYVADGAGSGSWTVLNTYRTRTVAKTSDTSRSLTTSLAADPTLVVPVLANSKYILDIFFRGTSGSLADFKFAYVLPASATGNGILSGISNSTNTNYIINSSAGIGTSNAIVVSTDSGSGNFAFKGTIYISVSGTAGDVAFYWAQNVASGSTTIAAGSYIDYRKIA